MMKVGVLIVIYLREIHMIEQEEYFDRLQIWKGYAGVILLALLMILRRSHGIYT